MSGVAAVRRVALLLAVVFDERREQPVAPGPAGLPEPRLYLLGVVIRDRAGLGLDDEVEPAERLVAELRVVGGDRAVDRRREDVLHRVPQHHGIAFARHVDEGRDEALAGIAPQEQREALAPQIGEATSRKAGCQYGSIPVV